MSFDQNRHTTHITHARIKIPNVVARNSLFKPNNDQSITAVQYGAANADGNTE